MIFMPLLMLCNNTIALSKQKSKSFFKKFHFFIISEKVKRLVLRSFSKEGDVATSSEKANIWSAPAVHEARLRRMKRHFQLRQGYGGQGVPWSEAFSGFMFFVLKIKKGLLQNLMFRSSPPCNNYVVAKPRNGGIRWDLLFHQIHESGVEFQAVFNAA